MRRTGGRSSYGSQVKQKKKKKRYSPATVPERRDEISDYDRELTRRAKQQTITDRDALREWARGRSPVDMSRRSRYEAEDEARRKRYQNQPPRPRSAETVRGTKLRSSSRSRSGSRPRGGDPPDSGMGQSISKLNRKQREASQLRRDILDVERQEQELKQERQSLHQQIADRERRAKQEQARAQPVKQERARALSYHPEQRLSGIKEEGHTQATVLLKQEEQEYLQKVNKREQEEDFYEKEFRRQQSASKARERDLRRQLDLSQLRPPKPPALERGSRSVSERARANAARTMSRGAGPERSLSRLGEDVTHMQRDVSPIRKRQRSAVTDEWRARVEGRSVLQKMGSAVKTGVKNILGVVGIRERTPPPGRSTPAKRARTMDEIRAQIHTPHGHIDPKKHREYVKKHILPTQGFRPPGVGSLRNKPPMSQEEVERQFDADAPRRHKKLNKTWHKTVNDIYQSGSMTHEEAQEELAKEHPQIRSEKASARDKSAARDKSRELTPSPPPPAVLTERSDSPVSVPSPIPLKGHSPVTISRTPERARSPVPVKPPPRRLAAVRTEDEIWRDRVEGRGKKRKAGVTYPPTKRSRDAGPPKLDEGKRRAEEVGLLQHTKARLYKGPPSGRPPTSPRKALVNLLSPGQRSKRRALGRKKPSRNVLYAAGGQLTEEPPAPTRPKSTPTVREQKPLSPRGVKPYRKDLFSLLTPEERAAAERDKKRPVRARSASPPRRQDPLRTGAKAPDRPDMMQYLTRGQRSAQRAAKRKPISTNVQLAQQIGDTQAELAAAADPDAVRASQLLRYQGTGAPPPPNTTNSTRTASSRNGSSTSSNVCPYISSNPRGASHIQ